MLSQFLSIALLSNISPNSWQQGKSTSLTELSDRRLPLDLSALDELPLPRLEAALRSSAGCHHPDVVAVALGGRLQTNIAGVGSRGTALVRLHMDIVCLERGRAPRGRWRRGETGRTRGGTRRGVGELGGV